MHLRTQIPAFKNANTLEAFLCTMQAFPKYCPHWPGVVQPTTECQMKVFLSLQKGSKMYDIWTLADCLTTSCAIGNLAKFYWGECGGVCICITNLWLLPEQFCESLGPSVQVGWEGKVLVGTAPHKLSLTGYGQL